MKKISFLLFFVAMAATQSCQKHDDAPKNVVINATLASGADYRLNLLQYGKTGSSATIVQQAGKAAVSEVIADSLIYHYQAATKTSLTDQVILKVTEPRCGNGADSTGGRKNDNDDVTNITINFVVK